MLLLVKYVNVLLQFEKKLSWIVYSEKGTKAYCNIVIHYVYGCVY